MDSKPADGDPWTNESIVFFASSLGEHEWRRYGARLDDAKIAHSLFDSWFRERKGERLGEISYYGLKLWVYKFIVSEANSERIDIESDYRSMSAHLVFLGAEVGGIQAARAFQAFVEGQGKPYIFSNKPDRQRKRDVLIGLMRGGTRPVTFYEIRQDER